MERVTSTSQTEENKTVMYSFSCHMKSIRLCFFLRAQKVIFLKNVLDHMMRAGGVFVVIDVRDTDIEEEIYQKGTHVLRQKNLQSSDFF